MRSSLVRHAGCVSIATAALFAGSLFALPATSAVAGGMKQPSATLQVQKIVGYPSETGFVIHVVCTRDYTTDVQAESAPDVYLPYNSDGTPDEYSPDAPDHWYVVGGTWEHNFYGRGGGTCTATETDQGDAVLVRYTCNWDAGDQELPASLGVEYPGCPGTRGRAELLPRRVGNGHPGRLR